MLEETLYVTCDQAIATSSVVIPSVPKYPVSQITPSRASLVASVKFSTKETSWLGPYMF